MTIFASGVSNSLESRDAEFSRERTSLLRALDTASLLVYFGSYASGFSDGDGTPYLRHKLEMQSLVVSSGKGLVFLLPQVVGKTANPRTLANFLYARISAGENFTVWNNAERNLVDVDDVVRICEVLIAKGSKSGSIPITSDQSISMPELVTIFEQVLGKKAVFSTVNKGVPLPVRSGIASEAASDLGIDLGGDYVERVIRKYYGVRRVAG